MIATVACDAPWGRLVSYRPYSFAERELLQLNNEIPVSLRYHLTDDYGRRLPPLAPSQHLFMQLSILSYEYIEE